jgi:hypothetical protein
MSEIWREIDVPNCKEPICCTSLFEDQAVDHINRNQTSPDKNYKDEFGNIVYLWSRMGVRLVRGPSLPLPGVVVPAAKGIRKISLRRKCAK